MSDINKIFGKRLAEIRRRHNLQQPEFGEKLGIHSQTVSRYERGLITPGLDILVKISETFDVSLDWLASNNKKTQISNKYVKIPFIDDPAKYWFIDELFLQNLTFKTELSAYVMKNNHMYPALQKNDLVLIDTNENTPSIDKLVVIRSGSEHIVKRVSSILKGNVHLISNDDSIKPVAVPVSDIVGTVEAFCRGSI